MLSSDRAVGVVFNGEIYNYRDLRHELNARGCRFNSQTDTEVLLHGYRDRGLDQLVSKLRGMFAFALWDDRQRRLCLVRDRLGVKPLLFARRGETIAFASTVRALRRAGFVSQLNEDAVLDFLELGYITDNHAIYDGASKVPAATIVEWSDGVLSQRQYWAPPPVCLAPALSFQEALTKTEQLFLEAISAIACRRARGCLVERRDRLCARLLGRDAERAEPHSLYDWCARRPLGRNCKRAGNSAGSGHSALRVADV